jgi:hypothetical protein
VAGLKTRNVTPSSIVFLLVYERPATEDDSLTACYLSRGRMPFQRGHSWFIPAVAAIGDPVIARGPSSSVVIG